MPNRHAGLLRRSALALTAALVASSAAAQAQEPLATLRRGGHVVCEPAHPFFCANVHVSCAGATSIPTFAFRLQALPSGGTVSALGGGEAVAEPYAHGRVEWSADGASVILRPAGALGYIKVHADGRYVLRHYPQHEGVMSLGRCS